MAHGESAHPDPASRHRARGAGPVVCWVLTISDTRTPEDDASGDEVRAHLARAGHPVQGSQIVKDDPLAIRAAVEGAIAAGVQAIISSGGTGLTARDSTFEVLNALIERPLPGFGELFRALSFEEVGAAAMLSRALAGVVQGVVVFALPGSTKGVRLGMQRLIAPELGHIIDQLSR